LGWGV